MPLLLFKNIEEKDKSQAIEMLIRESTPSQDFFLMVILSVLMAAFGIIINSIPVIIGSMLIAPILYPVLSVALGVVISDFKLLSRSFYTILKSVIFGVGASALVAALYLSKEWEVSPEIIGTIGPSTLYVGIAAVAGAAASFALVKYQQFKEALPGIAISVALIPPLAMTGIGIAKLNWILVIDSFALFLVNILGITISGVIVFSLAALYPKRKEAEKVIKEEEKIIEKEKKEAEKEKS